MDFNGRFHYVSPSVEGCAALPRLVMKQSFEEIIFRFSQPDHGTYATGGPVCPYRPAHPARVFGNRTALQGWQHGLDEATAQLVFNEYSEPVRFIGLSRNIMERKRAELQSIHDATHDSLTGLPNRVYSWIALKKRPIRSPPGGNLQGSLFWISMVSKFINDSLGHLYGDL